MSLDEAAGADVHAAVALIDSGKPELVREGLEHLRTYAESRPDDAVAWFRYGGGLDSSGNEAAAMVAYDRVFELGVELLDPGDRPRCYMQAGSTLRNLGRLDEARTLLEDGRRRFPDVRVLAVFLALVEVSAGRERRAIDLLFDVILGEGSGDDSIGWFPRSLADYVTEIRQA